MSKRNEQWFNTIKYDPIQYKLPGNIGDTYLTKVIYNNPATIAFWEDGSKTIAKCDSESIYSEDVGLLICILKKCLGAQNAINIIKYWTKEQNTFDTNESHYLLSFRLLRFP